MANIILVVDMVKGFHNIGNLKNPRTALIIPNIKDLLERKADDREWTVVFLCDYHKPDDKEFKMFPPHCVEGTIETEVVNELPLVNSYICRKTRYSGFYGTPLKDFIKRENPEKVVVVGVCTDICVLHTVADLRNMDYEVIVPKDCTETFSAPGHSAKKTKKWALLHMKNILGATIVKSQKEI